MKIAVVGGGINGVMSAWSIARRRHQVDLYEAGELIGATSSASTKLIHGGLRYLEHGEFRLVRESLRERTFWISAAPHLVRPIEIIVPLYKHSRRSRWLMHLGLLLYDLLAGKSRLGRFRRLGSSQMRDCCPELNTDELQGGFVFFDAQMDDRALGLWAADKAAEEGVMLHSRTKVNAFRQNGEIQVGADWKKYDIVVNVAGPWAEAMLEHSGIQHDHCLDLVRGSHIVLARETNHAFLVEVPGEERLCFILPYQGKTLVGTTEVRQSLTDPITCSPQERSYLLKVYNRYIRQTASEQHIVQTFAGLRPLIRSAANQSRATREYAIETHGRIVSIFGGKWTTSRALGDKVATAVEDLLLKEGRA
jgi:glycerol-3-phosphate dehydrogenase